MNIAQFNARGPNDIEHWYTLIYEELQRQGHSVRQFNLRSQRPTIQDREWMDFAVIHFAQVAQHYMRMGVPFCVLPSANDIFPDNGTKLLQVANNTNCKFVTYQSFYHKRKYDEWGIPNDKVYVPMPIRTELFTRRRKFNPNGRVIAGGRLIPKKGLDRIIPYVNYLTIFGDGPLKQQLQYLNPTTMFTGHLTGESLKNLMEESWLYLYPAIVDSSGDSDGIPNTVKEAMYMGLQVIASPVAGLPELENISLLDNWSKINEVISTMPRKFNYKGKREISNLYTPEICTRMLLKGIEEYVSR